MKTATHIGNVTLVFDKSLGRDNPRILLGRKRPKDDKDKKRKRRRIGIGCWMPPGGATETTDKSQKHSAQRELSQETKLSFPLRSFQKVGILRGYLDGPNTPTWLVHIYTVHAPDGNLEFAPNEEYSEMRWFHLRELPFREMLQGDANWIPRVVKGQKLSIRLVVSENANKAHSIHIKPLKSFN